MKPASANIIDVNKNVAAIIKRLKILISTKNEIVRVTAKPTQKPLAMPPLTNPSKIIQFGVVETSNSSKLLLYLVIKKDETVLA